MGSGSNYILTCSAAIGLIATIAAAQALDPGELYKRASPAVVLIEALGPEGKVKSRGSGVLVSADGKLLTNFHVVEHTKQATVRLANGDAYDTVEVLSVDRRKDIAFLKIPAVELPFLQLGRSRTVDVGAMIYSIGSPLGLLKNTLSHGLVSGVRDMDGYKLFQISAPISPGSSGGPILNATGEVIALAVSTIQEGQNLNFAIPIDYARGMLSANNPQPLASIYEPDPEPAPSPPEPSATVKSSVSLPSSSPLVVSEEMRKGSFVYLERKIRSWKLENAKAELGEPIRQRDALTDGKTTGVIYAFSDPTHLMREFELNFENATGLLTGVYAYPAAPTTLNEARKLWGTNYKETKYPNGNKGFVYNNRRLMLLTDKHDMIISLGVF